jgi:hypothetical protein
MIPQPQLVVPKLVIPELVNYIFRFCQGSTNKIMKEHIKNIKLLNENEDLYNILQMNMNFGYIYFDFKSFKIDYE